MAGPREVALGIASVLGKPGLPDPLLISFRGQTLHQAAAIVQAIVSECDDAGVGIHKIELDPDLEDVIMRANYSGTVRIVGQDDLVGEIRVFANFTPPSTARHA